jgi:hypothetical protein
MKLIKKTIFVAQCVMTDWATLLFYRLSQLEPNL